MSGTETGPEPTLVSDRMSRADQVDLPNGWVAHGSSGFWKPQ